MADASSGEDQAMAEAAERQGNLERAIYFYRTGDLTAWNYSILVLSILGLCLGLFLLGKNILNNRKRKRDGTYKENVKEDNSNKKQAVLMLEKENLPHEDAQLKKDVKPGDIIVQWKNDQITSLYRHVSEEDV
ncbi:organic solute transporter subunit beta [Eleutherodactylus coqui]|uniref:organic solute transporter subunit beta n=1 Tax=Eleutherodactylus coqui TaxID=57060 RepID=UPI0034633518